MNPTANPIAILPVNGIPKFDIANAAVAWLLLCVTLPIKLIRMVLQSNSL
jgi:hypothetical protein